jgi:molybdopterin synthase sulfur carrier subunit
MSAPIRLLFFARLKEDLGTAQESLALPADVATVGALREHLVARGGTWTEALAQGKAIRVAVNQEMAQPSTPIAAGDEVAFFPPVTGG